MVLTNWAGNVTFTGRVHRPASVAELQRLVAQSRRVRALGRGHSFNRLADGDGELVLLHGLPPDIDIDPELSEVTVAAGVTYAQLAPRLQKAGLALANLGSLPHVSVAGACATATHGSGPVNGSLATAVRGLELVTASGDLVRHGATDAMVVSLGMLGVVTRLTLSTVPAFTVGQRVYQRLPREVFDEQHEQILASAYSVSLFTTWTWPGFEQVWCKYRLGSVGVRPAPQPRSAPASGPQPPWPGAAAATHPVHPIAALPAAPCTPQLGVPGPWHERLPHFRAEFTPSSGHELQSEYYVPRQHLPQALGALDGIRALIAPVLQISEIRTVAADDQWLSPSHHRDSATIHFTWIFDPAAVAAVVDAVEERLAPYAPRPHWAKLFGSRAAAAIGEYERLPDLQRLLAEHDPAGKFGNDFTDRHIRRC